MTSVRILKENLLASLYFVRRRSYSVYLSFIGINRLSYPVSDLVLFAVCSCLGPAVGPRTTLDTLGRLLSI